MIFGTTRVAGNIIWSSGLREAANRRRQRGQGGGRPTSTTTSYSSSWAVGICKGPAVAIRCIWFDDELVYDASGASVQIEVPGLVWRFSATPNEAFNSLVAKLASGGRRRKVVVLPADGKSAGPFDRPSKPDAHRLNSFI